MRAPHSVHGARAQGRAKSAFEVFEGVHRRFLDVSPRAAGSTHGVDGIAHERWPSPCDGMMIPGSRLIGRWLVARACHPADLAEMPWSRSLRWRRLGRRARPDRAVRPMWRSCPAVRRRSGPSGYGQRGGLYVGRGCYRAVARLLGTAVAVVSLPLRNTAGRAHRIDVRVDGLTCVAYVWRANHPGRTEAVPDASGRSPRRSSQLQRSWGAILRSRLGRLGATEIGRWRWLE